MYRSIIVLEDAVTIREYCLEHLMYMISKNVQVIVAIDPTKHDNDGTERIPQYH